MSRKLNTVESESITNLRTELLLDFEVDPCEDVVVVTLVSGGTAETRHVWCVFKRNFLNVSFSNAG